MRIALHIMIAFIAAVAVYDIYCTVQLHDTLFECEENPVALWLVHRSQTLIHVNDPCSTLRKMAVPIFRVDVSRLVTLKACGLGVSISIMLAVIQSQRLTISLSVILPLAIGAALLLARLVL